MTDFEDLKERLDLLTEIEKDLGPGRQSGRWVLFHCPFPGHKHGDSNPSLSVTNDNGRYYCFSCGQSGDVITWLREHREMSWKDIKALVASDDLPPARPRSAEVCAQIIPQTETDPPSKAWQMRGMELITECASMLWSTAGEDALNYLRGRGLRDDTIRFYQLGFNLSDRWDKREAWGLPKDPDGRGVWLPKGVVIPCLITSDWSTREKCLWYIKIRRPTDDPKYLFVTGGRPALFGADNLYLAGNGAGYGLLCEGEFDCMLAAQELPEVGAATLGSAVKHLSTTAWGRYLLPLRWVLAAYDTDQAGMAGAAALAKAVNTRPVNVPVLRSGDKDLTDYHQAGGDLWQWLKYNLERLGALDWQGTHE